MKVLSYIESTMWAMLPSAYDRMHSIATRHSAEFDRALIDAVNNQKVDNRFLLTGSDGAKFNISSDVQIKPEALMTKRGDRLAGARYTTMRDGVAVIDLNGVIAMRMNFFQELCEGGTSTEMLARDFTLCLESPDVKSIVFLIHSPGGEAFGTHEFAQMVFAARGKKPIKAYVAGYGCSAAYFIACACDEIIIDAQAMVGSIGVVSEWQDATQLYKNLGIDRKVVTSSNAPKKRLDLNKPEDEAEFKATLDAMENVFIKFAAKARNVTVEKVKTEFGQGGVLIGKDAQKVGMVDRTGSLESVISELQRKPRKSNVSASAENHKLNNQGEMNMKKSFKERFLALFEEDESPSLNLNDDESEQTEKTEQTENTEKQEKTENSGNSSSAKSPALIAAEAEIARMRQEKQTETTNQIKASAETFVTAEIRAGRLFPSEKEDFVANFIQAMTDDQLNPLVSGSRIERIKAQQEKRKPHGLDKEALDPKTGAKTLNPDENPIATIERGAEEQASQYVSTITPKIIVVKN